MLSPSHGDNRRNFQGGTHRVPEHYTSSPQLVAEEVDEVNQDGESRSVVYDKSPSPLTLTPSGRGGTSIRSSPNTTMSTFSTFSVHKAGKDPWYKDDPNPYKVSELDKFRIQVHDPFKTKSSMTLNHGAGYGISQSKMSFYTEDDEGRDDDVDSGHVSRGPGPESPQGSPRHRISSKYETLPNNFYPHSAGSNNSGEYEIPDPDYEDVSSGGSSEDLPLPPSIPPPSESSEEYSHLGSMTASSVSGGPSPVPAPPPEPELHVLTTTNGPTPNDASMKISSAARQKIEYCLRGRKTWIFVADSLANLYYMSKSTPSRPQSMGSGTSQTSASTTGDWVLKYTGVPVLLLDTGETRSRDKRQIQIVLAELGSGLALWKDVIDNLTSYKVVESGIEDDGQGHPRPISTFHTMHMSSDHTRIVGLSFDNAEAAETFANRVDKLTSDFANISLSGSKNRGKKDTKVNGKVKPPSKYVRPKKSDISQPCCFQHVSSLNLGDKKLFSSLQEFVNPKRSGNSPAKSEISF